MEACSNPLTLDPDVCPALAPPNGVVPMDPDAYSLRSYLIATTVVCLSLSIPAASIRVFTKVYLLKNMQIEDYSLILAAAGFAAFAGVMTVPSSWGCGKHQWNVSITDTMRIMKYINIVQILYSPPMFFAKFTVLMQIQRIFCIHQRNFTFWAIQVLIAANAVIYLSVFLAFVFTCWPREAIWNPMVHGKCMNASAAMLTSSGINLVSDVTILILPLRGISTLRIPIKRKLGVSAVFAVGILAIIACILRLVYTVRLVKSKDITYWVVSAGCWSQAEQATVILCASFPTFPRFYRFLRGKSPRRNKYSSSSKPSSKSTVKAPSTNPYSGNESVKPGEPAGSNIPLEERTTIMGASNGEGASHHSRASLKVEEERPSAQISRTIEINTVPD